MTTDLSHNEGYSSPFGLEKKNSITSIESSLHTVEAGPTEKDENAVEPHMGLLSSCNMVSAPYTFVFLSFSYTLYRL